MSRNATIAIIDDHDSVRESLRALLESAGFSVRDYPSAIAYLADDVEGADCLLADLRMPRMTGLELHEELSRRSVAIPVIVVTGHGDVPMAVAAMRAGVFDFIEKPFDDEILLASIQRALTQGRRSRGTEAEGRAATELIDILTARERQVLDQLVQGKSNKLIGHELGISPRTVEIHRARLQEKLKARDLSDLVRLVRVAGLLN